MTCKCGGTLVRFFFCNDLRATVGKCEKCGQWHRIRRMPDQQLEASSLPKAEPKQETGGPGWPPGDPRWKQLVKRAADRIVNDLDLQVATAPPTHAYYEATPASEPKQETWRDRPPLL